MSTTTASRTGENTIAKLGNARLLWWIVGLVAVCVAPFVMRNYQVFQFTLVGVYAIAVLGLNILTGFNGQISLGHGAFYAIGAYTAAMLMEHLSFPFWATIPIAGVVCFGAGYLMGFPALRLGGHYLALATFALAVAMPQLLKWKVIEHWTGGVQGIVLIKPEVPFNFTAFGTKFNDDRFLYFIVLAIGLFMFWMARNLLRGRIGRALVAIRDHPIAAAAMGINLPVFKSMAFGVSAFYTGVAGALGGIVVAFVAPDSFVALLSITFLVGVVVGGLASIPGAVFGAVFIQFIPNVAEEISKSAPWAVYGVFLISFMFLMPAGIAGMLRRVWARVSAK